MSIEYLNKSFNSAIKPSSLKFVLVALSDFANEYGVAYPSIETLCGKTSQDRKTVLANLKKLSLLGLIIDTGNRVGLTRQITVWQISEEKLATLKHYRKRESVPKTGQLQNGTENGNVKGSRKRYIEPSPFLTPRVTTKTQAAVDLESYIRLCKHRGEKPIPGTDPVFDYFEQINLPAQYWPIAWKFFRDDMIDKNKRQKDWPQTFRNYVRKNYLKLWWLDDNGNYHLTTAGKQAWKIYAEQIA